MELRHLRYFVAVAEEQNVTRAAARLHVSQPPLSRQIRDLEDELGVTLFARSAKSLRLSEAGRVFLDEARAVLRRADEAVGTVRAMANGGGGEIHVGYAPSLAVEILPAALREFERISPGARVSLHDLSTEEMFARLRDGRLHIALMIRPHSRTLGTLRFTEIRRYALCVAMPSAHPFTRGPLPTLARIFSERLVAYTRADYPEYHGGLSSLAPSAPRISEEHDSSTSLVAAIEAGRGIALVPETFACFSGARLRLRRIAGEIAPLVVGAVVPKGGTCTLAERFLKAASQ